MRVLRISHSAVVDAWRERERELRKRGHDVVLVSARVWDEGGRPTPLVTGEDTFVTGVRTIGNHPNLFMYDPLPLWRLLRQSWDVVDIHEEPYSLAAAEILLLKAIRRSRAPFSLYSAQNIDKRFPIPFRWLEHIALRRAAAISVCNAAAGQIAKRKGLSGAVELIPLGVDIERFTPSHRESPDATAIKIGYVGRFEHHKGVHVLLHAIALRPELRADLVGAGPYESELRKLIHTLALGDRVRILGHVTHQDLPDTYRSFDVLAVPSLPTNHWLEQFCRVAIEAMASGIPVVASDSGALPDVIGDSGILVPPGDPQALGDTLVRIGHDKDRHSDLCDRGVERAREFTWSRVAERYDQMYSTMRNGPVGLPASTADRGDRAPEVIVVAYGSADDLAKALSPLAHQYAITVVDNSSHPANRAVTEANGARYLDPGTNLGFGAGVNYAVAHRQQPGADVLLLNPDAVIQPEAVARLHRALEADPMLACVAPSQTDDNGVRARVGWPFPRPADKWLEAVGLARWRARDDFVIGAVLLIRDEALRAVGGFDDRFFLYAEETDWQFRAAKAGWRMREISDVSASHTGGGTSSDPIRREIHFHASQERYARKHFGALGWQSYRGAVFAGSAIRAVLLRDARGTAAR